MKKLQYQKDKNIALNLKISVSFWFFHFNHWIAVYFYMEYITLKVIPFFTFTFVESYGINKDNYLAGNFKDQVKKIIVDTAKEWPTYFAKLFPVAVSILKQFLTKLNFHLLVVYL